MQFEVSSIEDISRVQAYMMSMIEEIQSGKKFDCIIDTHREKRSKNANDYSWVLQNQIAKKLSISIDELHNKMVLEYGVLETYSIIKDAFESAKRMFDYFEVLGESEVKGKVFIHVKAGLGTHTYNTKEMATFIDGVVQEAQELGIETKTPNEIKEMLSLWEQGTR